MQNYKVVDVQLNSKRIKVVLATILLQLYPLGENEKEIWLKTSKP